MNNGKLHKFVETYEKYYFKVTKSEKRDGLQNLGVSINHPSDLAFEEEIEEFLCSGRQDVKTIAWKMNASISQEGIKARYHNYPREDIEKFCEHTNNAGLMFDDGHLLSTYNTILDKAKECNISGYGSVYIISSMYFLSKGSIPIYDYYANVAVKALLYDICPQDVFVPEAPGKEDTPKGDKLKRLAVNMLMEYKLLLEKLAKGTDYYDKDGMIITRDLDRALWVYGHANKKWRG